MFGTGSRFGPLAMLSLLVSLFLPLIACAEPGYRTVIPAAAFVAASGGDATALPADTAPIVSEGHWYDRQVSFHFDGQRAGNQFGFDYVSSSDAGNALEARRSDNDRARANLGDLFGLLQTVAAAAAQSQGVQLPQGGTAAPSTLDTKLEERLAALEQTLSKLVEQMARASPAPTPPAPEVTLPPDANAGGD